MLQQAQARTRLPLPVLDVTDPRRWLWRSWLMLVACAGVVACADKSSPESTDPSGAVDGPATANGELTVTLDGEHRLPANLTLKFRVTRKDGTPVVGLGPKHLTLLENGSEPTPSESNATAFPVPVSFGLYTVLILDLSGSVTEANLAELIGAAQVFVRDLLPSGHKIALYFFQTNIHEVAEFSNDEQALVEALEGLKRRVVAGATTNLYGSFSTGIEALDAVVRQQERQIVGSVVVFTDGADRADLVSFADAERVVSATQHAVFTVGLQTPDLDQPTLDRLGRSGTIRAGDPGQLSKAFSEAAEAVLAQGRNLYVLKYCSSKRANEHTVELVVTDDDGRQGSAVYAFDATGFADGCYSEVEQLKLRYYDSDHDGYYTVAGPRHDCDDSDRQNWSACDTCKDLDGDGVRGQDCDMSDDCDESNAAIYSTAGCPVDLSFELGGFAPQWSTGGDAGWTIACRAASRGECSAASGPIGPRETTWLRLAAEIESGQLCFDFKPSGRRARDKLALIVDEQIVEELQTSDDGDWLGFCASLSAGPHIIEWRHIGSDEHADGQPQFVLDNITL